MRKMKTKRIMVDRKKKPAMAIKTCTVSRSVQDDEDDAGTVDAVAGSVALAYAVDVGAIVVELTLMEKSCQYEGRGQAHTYSTEEMELSSTTKDAAVGSVASVGGAMMKDTTNEESLAVSSTLVKRDTLTLRLGATFTYEVKG
jgi:hypothetical protein